MAGSLNAERVPWKIYFISGKSVSVLSLFSEVTLAMSYGGTCKCWKRTMDKYISSINLRGLSLFSEVTSVKKMCCLLWECIILTLFIVWGCCLFFSWRDVCLPKGWQHILPDVDRKWVSKALFRWSRNGIPEMDFARVDKMWWDPPPPLVCSSVLVMEKYFARPLLRWMPRKLWQVKLYCPNSDCERGELTKY